MSTNPISEECTIAAAPGAVAAAIASPIGLATWFCDDARVEKRPGGRISLSWHEGGRAYGRWTAYDPPSQLAWRWRDETKGIDAAVTFALNPRGDGTHVRVTEEGIATEDADVVTRQWQDALADLKVYVEEGHNARELRRPMMGISPMPVTPEEAKRKGYPVERGIVISSLTSGGGAEAAGLAKDDIVVKIDSREVSDWPSLTAALAAHRAGDTVDVVVWRAGQQLTKPVTLKGRERPELPGTPAALREALGQTTTDLVTRLEAALAGVDEALASREPSPGEWSIKQVLAHLLVSERYGQDWLARAAVDDAQSDWPERADVLLQRAMVHAPTADLAGQLVGELRQTQALIQTVLADNPAPPVFHQLAAHVNFMPTHLGEHIAQIQAAREAVAAE